MVSNGIVGPSGRARRARGAEKTMLEAPSREEGAAQSGNRLLDVPTQATLVGTRDEARDVSVAGDEFEVGVPLLNRYLERCCHPSTVKLTGIPYWSLAHGNVLKQKDEVFCIFIVLYDT